MQTAVIEMIHKFREILFPGYFNRARLDPANLSYHIGQTVAELFDMLAEQISRGIRRECFKYDLECTDCRERGYRHALSSLESVPEMQNILAPSDIQIRTHDTSKSSARSLSTT